MMLSAFRFAKTEDLCEPIVTVYLQMYSEEAVHRPLKA